MSKAEKTKAYIIEKTAPVFNRKGYAGTSLSDLTEATGLSKGALYGNFRNKDEIALAAFDYNTRIVRGTFITRRDGQKSSIEQLLDIPEFYKKHYAHIASYGGCPILNTAVEADDTFPRLRKKVNSTLQSWKKNITEIIQNGIDTGEITPGADPAKYASVFIALFEGGLLLSKTTGDLEYINASLDRMTDMIQKELKA